MLCVERVLPPRAMLRIRSAENLVLGTLNKLDSCCCKCIALLAHTLMHTDLHALCVTVKVCTAKVCTVKVCTAKDSCLILCKQF